MDTMGEEIKIWGRSGINSDFVSWNEARDLNPCSTTASNVNHGPSLFAQAGFPGNMPSTIGANGNGLNPHGGWLSSFWQPRCYPYLPGPGSGLSRQSSQDDLTSVELEHIFDYEERFRVDRRKLENLILGRFEPIKENAADFFLRVGNETGTTVIWPSRLKVGAKSKKDPHIRIGGSEDGVNLAKSLILEHLDTKTRRVTMKMDVSYTDHSHIIGKGGNTIRRVMAETGCHIHFPDSNRSNPNEKSNQVSIAGEMEGVEKARARVRELTPLMFTFDLPIVSSIDVSMDANDPFLKDIQDQYNIQLMFRQKQKNFHTTMAVVKGCEWEAARVKEATLLLIEHLCAGSNGSGSQVFPVTMTMEISPIHHSVVVGKNNINLRVIMQRTNTTILFPDAADPNIPPIRKGSVSITGAIHNVYLARQQLVGSLPLVMMFDMPDGVDVIDTDMVQKMGEELDVSISIKSKHRQGCKSVLIKAQERHASAIYGARRRLLNIEDDEEPPVVADVPETYKIQPIPPHLMQTLGAMGPKKTVVPPIGAAAFGGIGGHQQQISPFLLPAATQAPWALNNFLTPNHPYLQDYAMLVLNNITRLQQQQFQLEEQQRKARDPNNNDGCWGDKNELGKGELEPHSPPAEGRSPRNSSPVQDGGNMTNQLESKMMHLSLDEKDEGLGSSAGANISASSTSSTFFQLDRRAPGCEMKSLQKQLDYDQKRLLATRAVHQPGGKSLGPEPRMPTPSWSGLGFSNSMPEHVIREKLVAESKLETEADAPWFGNSSAFDAAAAHHSQQQFMGASNLISSTDDLPDLLSKQGLAKYTELFVRHEVDLQTFASLTEQDLKEIGVQTFGARKKLLLLANKLKQTAGEKWQSF